MSDPSPADLLAVAAAAARAAGVVLVDHLGRPAEVGRKNDRTSLVTDVDLAAQAEIERVIGGHFPQHAIVGEEGRGGAEGGPFTWLVDPLDGTSNFAHGVPLACTSIAVCDEAGVVAGAIFEPFREELFTAVRGGGAWLGADRLRVTATDTLAQAIVCTGVQSDDAAAVAAFGQRIVALGSTCRAVRCLGSPALCLAYIAAGRIDAFLEADSTYAWDVGAGALLITEAGGRIDDLDGGPLNLGPGIANVLASNGLVHDALASLVRAVQTDQRVMTLANKRIVVTGGGRGIGAALAGELRARGADVLTADIQPGADVTCDISDAGQVDDLFGRAGAVDGLVNSAALLVDRQRYDEISLDEWDRMFAVNVRGSFLCARAAAASMAGRGGSIVNVASETALTGSHGFVHYVASKGAVMAMTRALANELGPMGIRVNCVAPGFTPTPGSEVLGPYDPSRTPLGRVMRPDDLLGTFCYLLSDDSAFVSGQTIVVNGGRVPH